jgi:predicted metal-dependent peptidase
MGKLVIMVDTSGSVGEEELRQMASEVKGITDAYHVDILIIYVDHDVSGIDEIDSWSPDFDLHPKGGGGTSFVPGFEYVEENQIQPACGIYLTDGWSHEFPEEPPPYPFIWVLTETYKDFSPPFGDVIEMPMEEERSYE